MAAIGSAVGLGNLWQFPFKAATNGGAAFVVFYRRNRPSASGLDPEGEGRRKIK